MSWADRPREALTEAGEGDQESGDRGWPSQVLVMSVEKSLGKQLETTFGQPGLRSPQCVRTFAKRYRQRSEVALEDVF